MVELVTRLVFSLAVVLGLLWLCVRVAGRRFGGRSDAMVRVLHRQSISRNAAVTVVSVGQRVLVLGATDQQVQVLAELDPAEVGEGQAHAQHDNAPGSAPSAGPGTELVSKPVVELPVVVAAASTAAVADRALETSHADLLASARLSAAIASALAAIPEQPSVAPAVVEVADRSPRESPVPVTGRRRATVDTDTSTTRYRGGHTLRAPTPAPALEPAVLPATTPAPSATSASPVRGVSVAGDLLEQLERFESLVAAGPTQASASTVAAAPPVPVRRRPDAAAPSEGRLAGSVLAPQTWRLAWGAVTGRAS